MEENVNLKIGDHIVITDGLYTVVKPNEEVIKFISQCAFSGYFITSFKMNFPEQEGVYIGNNRMQLTNGVVIQL